MNPNPLLHPFVARLFALALLALLSSAVLAQADPPGRVGRLNYSQGSVSFSPAGDNEWTEAQPNRPLTRGDRLWTDRGSRAEIQIGSSAVRLDGQTRVEIMVLDDQAAQLSLTQGSLYVRVRSLPDGENFEIDTPNLAYRAAYPGDYRIDVDANDGTTRVTIHSGTGAVYGEGGHAMPLGGGQQITFRARALAQVTTQESPPQDAFDRWAAERNRQEDQSIAARYVPREVVGYQQLDAHGQWKKDATHGAVWFPQGTPANWAPYRNGRWEWISPWGWTWIDDAPWGFAPFHYGRWALIESRWAWVPGRLGLRPVYAPALVAFIGNGGGILSSLAGRSSVTWFPLAPGEMWQPGFRASGAYISNVNRNMLPGSSDAAYTYQRRPEALTAISGDDFQRGRPAGAGWLRIATDALTNAAIVPPPAKPERIAVAKASITRPAPPPTQLDVRRVTANSVTSPQAEAHQSEKDTPQPAAQAKGLEQAKAAGQIRAAAQGKVALQAKAAEPAQEAAPAKAVAQAKAAEQAKAMEQAKATAQANAVAHARAAEQAKAEQGKAAGQARAAEQAKATAQARVTEQARRAEQARQSKLAAQEQAKAAQQARLEQQRKMAEQSRLAEQAKLAERARRAEVARAEAAAQPKQAKRTQRPEVARDTVAARHEQAQLSKRNRQQQAGNRAELAKREQLAQREQKAKRAELVRQQAQARRNERLLAKARRDEQLRAAAQARQDEQMQRIAHAQRVEQARRSAERDALALREQRIQREAVARREAEREQAQRQAVQRQQQAAAEQLRRDQQQAWEEQQQLERARSRPDLRDPRNRPPDVWQRGIPILNSGRTS
ncbi:MAG: DUF6600 domain-containing protein [Ramlibacter sp.]